MTPGPTSPPVGARLGDPGLHYPVAALNLGTVRHNVSEMDRYCRRASVAIAPHAKTTMVREVIALQLTQPSTWGLTVADVTQARLADPAGARRILIANQLIENDDIAWVARRGAQGLAVMSLVDSVEGVRLLDTALAAAWAGANGSPRHPVLLELGYPGGRCGARTLDEVEAVVAAVGSSGWLVVRGVSGFEGLLGTRGDADDLDRVDSYLERLNRSALHLASRWGVRGPEAILSAGGSAYFDRVVEICRPAAGEIGGQLLLRSGCYAIHDHGIYARTFPGVRARPGPELRPAAAVWARVQSRPDPGRAVAAVGRRHLPHDAGLPVPLGVCYRDGVAGPVAAGLRAVALSDQHLHLAVPDGADLRVGDVLPVGISHPCGLFDRWRRLALVDDQRRVTGSVAPAF